MPALPGAVVTAALPVLGVDPGRTGAACLLGADERVVSWWLWRPSGAEDGPIRLWTSGGTDWVFEEGMSHIATLMARVVDDLTDMGGAVVVVEGLYVPRPREGMVCRRKAPETEAYLGLVRHVLTLAELTGAILDPLQSVAVGEVLRPKAEQWRREILSIKRGTPSDEAEARAIAACRGGLVRGLEEVADPHLAEAAMIARWGWVQQRAAGRG